MLGDRHNIAYTVTHNAEKVVPSSGSWPLLVI